MFLQEEKFSKMILLLHILGISNRLLLCSSKTIVRSHNIVDLGAALSGFK